jgi:hypothetical protein
MIFSKVMDNRRQGKRKIHHNSQSLHTKGTMKGLLVPLGTKYG